MITPDLDLILSKFNCYEFVEDTHTYYWNGCPVDISVTKFINKYFEEFDSETISKNYAKKHGLTQQEVLADWELKGLVASTTGTIVHFHLENLKRGKRLKFDFSSAIEHNILPLVQEKLAILIPKAEKFHIDSKQWLIPLKLEYTVGVNTKLAGNIDFLCWNTYDNEIQIWDYKNTKGIKTTAFKDKRCYYPFNFLPDCNYSHYCMQLNFYKAMIEQELGLKVGKMFLVSFDTTDISDNYTVYECVDLQEICRKELLKL